jgi:hypothetical protein
VGNKTRPHLERGEEKQQRKKREVMVGGRFQGQFYVILGGNNQLFRKVVRWSVSLFCDPILTINS